MVLIDPLVERELYTETLTLMYGKYSDFHRNQAIIDHKIDAIFPLGAIVGTPACEAEPAKALATNHVALQILAEEINDNVMVV